MITKIQNQKLDTQIASQANNLQLSDTTWICSGLKKLCHHV